MPVLRDQAEEGEVQRRVPEATVEAFREADLFRAIVPTELGGHGLGSTSVANGTRLLAHGCPAQAWTLSFLVLHGWLLARLPERGRAEVFADGPVALAPAPLAPTGQVERVDGGFVVTGRWEWATGVAHAEWVMVHALDTRRLRQPLRRPADRRGASSTTTGSRRACGPPAAARSGSRAASCPSTAPSPRRPCSTAASRSTATGWPAPRCRRCSAWSPRPLRSAPPRRSVDLYRERLATRVLAYSLGDKAAEQPAAQVRLATAMSDLASARARWDATIATVAAAASAGAVDDRLRVEARVASAATVRASRRVIADVCEGAGASVYRSSHPIQRFQRDVETLKGHVLFDWDRTAELAGRFALGFDLRPTDLV